MLLQQILRNLNIKIFIGFALYLILFLFPFSYEDFNEKNIAFFILTIILGIIFLLTKNNLRIKLFIYQIIITTCFLLLFTILEESILSNNLFLTISHTKKISISTIILITGFLLFLLSSFRERKIFYLESPFFQYFFFTTIFLLVLLLLFYFLLKETYDISYMGIFFFTNKMLKYVFIIIILNYFLDTFSKLKLLVVSVILSLSFTVFLFFSFKI